MKKILVTGGLGFIGSHTVIQLLENGYEPVIVDNLVNSKLEVLNRLEKITGVRPKFYQLVIPYFIPEMEYKLRNWNP